MSNYNASARSVNTSGDNSNGDVVNAFDLRFGVFLGPGTMFSGGTGSKTNSFVIQE